MITKWCIGFDKGHRSLLCLGCHGYSLVCSKNEQPPFETSSELDSKNCGVRDLT